MNKIIKIFIIEIIMLCLCPAIKGANNKQPSATFFDIKNNITIVGMSIGWGPSFKTDGCARDYVIETYNVTASLNYSKNGRYVVEGPEGICTNPSHYTFTFGVDVPVFRKNKFLFGVNPIFGWEVDYYYPNYTYTKAVSVYRENKGFKCGIGCNFDINFIDEANIRISPKYINNALSFSIGFTTR